VIGKPDFASAQKQQAPAQARACASVARGAGLALLVCQHIGRLSRLSRVNLGQFVKNQQRIAMLRSD